MKYQALTTITLSQLYNVETQEEAQAAFKELLSELLDRYDLENSDIKIIPVDIKVE